MPKRIWSKTWRSCRNLTIDICYHLVLEITHHIQQEMFTFILWIFVVVFILQCISSQHGDIILAWPPAAIKSGMWRHEEISYMTWWIKRGREQRLTPTNRRRITGQDHTKIGGWGSPRQNYGRDHTQKLRLGTLSLFENISVWIIVFITSLIIMVNVKLKLPITLFASLLDWRCCWAKFVFSF